MNRELAPKSITVMGGIVKIQVKELDDAMGIFYPDRMLIVLDEEQTNEEAHRTLVHEVGHCILYLSGLTNLLSVNLEEAIVCAFENGLADMMYFRKEVLK